MSLISHTHLNEDLYHAVLIGDIKRSKECLANGGDPNYIEMIRTLLVVAVINDNLEMARLILDHGADPNLKSKDGLTPYMQAKSGAMVKLLAEYGANPNVSDGRFKAIDYYVAYDCVDAVKAWRELGWPVPRNTKKLLNRLLAKGRFEMISLLTGFQFKTEHVFTRMAEFKARYV